MAREIISFSAEDFNSFLLVCRNGGFAIVHPGKNTFPAAHYLDYLASFLADEKTSRVYPGIDRIHFGEVLLPQDKERADLFASTLSAGNHDIFSRLPLGIFISNSSITHTAQLQHPREHHDYIDPRRLGHHVYSVFCEYHLLPEVHPSLEGRVEVPR